MATDQEVKALAEAMWQLLDDMGPNGNAACTAAWAQARVAYEPFHDPAEDGEMDLPFNAAKAMLAAIPPN